MVVNKVPELQFLYTLMELIGMGNNPMVGASVAVAAAISQA